MNRDRSDMPQTQDKYAQLERAFIDEYLHRSGYDRQTVDALPQEKRAALLTQASEYAALKLAEVEARAHYIHEIHGPRKE